MKLKKEEAGNFLLSAVSVCTIFFVVLFSSYRTTASIEFPSEKKAGFSTSIRFNETLSLCSAPVNVPSPAIFAKKGHSSRISIVSKFIHVDEQAVYTRYADLLQTSVIVPRFQPLRLHIALRVLRI